MIPLTTREFWDNEHRLRSHDALSGNSLQDHLTRLAVDIPPEAMVLCIGVGEGDWIRDLPNRKWALDISPIALHSIAGCVDHTVDSPASLPVDFFDFALSLWVAPHMTKDVLEEQIWCVTRSLTAGGVFALQYCESWDGEYGASDYQTARAGGIKLGRETVLAMVDRCDAVAQVAFTMRCPDYRLDQVTMHIRRKP